MKILAWNSPCSTLVSGSFSNVHGVLIDCNFSPVDSGDFCGAYGNSVVSSVELCFLGYYRSPIDSKLVNRVMWDFGTSFCEDIWVDWRPICDEVGRSKRQTWNHLPDSFSLLPRCEMLVWLSLKFPWRNIGRDKKPRYGVRRNKQSMKHFKLYTADKSCHLWSFIICIAPARRFISY
jgi:hypothetical protein